MARQKIRIGIEINHVIRNINRQLAKYYQKEYDADIDLDTLDYTRDIWHEVCKFKSDRERVEFMYENYPYEIFGMANETEQMSSRDLNLWIKRLENQEDYDVEIFLYSLKDYDMTISSTYYFLAKLGSRVRKVIFPKNIEELMHYGNIFITSNPDVINTRYIDLPLIIIKKQLNEKAIADREKFCANDDGYNRIRMATYDSFKEFVNDRDNLDTIVSLITGKQIKKKNKITNIINWFKKKWQHVQQGKN